MLRQWNRLLRVKLLLKGFNEQTCWLFLDSEKACNLILMTVLNELGFVYLNSSSYFVEENEGHDDRNPLRLYQEVWEINFF